MEMGIEKLREFEAIKIKLGALMREFEDVPEDEQVRLSGRATTVIEQLSDLSQALNRLQRGKMT